MESKKPELNGYSMKSVYSEPGTWRKMHDGVDQEVRQRIKRFIAEVNKNFTNGAIPKKDALKKSGEEVDDNLLDELIYGQIGYFYEKEDLQKFVFRKFKRQIMKEAMKEENFSQLDLYGQDKIKFETLMPKFIQDAGGVEGYAMKNDITNPSYITVRCADCKKEGTCYRSDPEITFYIAVKDCKQELVWIDYKHRLGDNSKDFLITREWRIFNILKNHFDDVTVDADEIHDYSSWNPRSLNSRLSFEQFCSKRLLGSTDYVKRFMVSLQIPVEFDHKTTTEEVERYFNKILKLSRSETLNNVKQVKVEEMKQAKVMLTEEETKELEGRLMKDEAPKDISKTGKKG